MSLWAFIMLYESEQDRIHQRQAQRVVEEMFGWDIEELNIRYHADWIAFVNKKPHALIEYKRRHCEHDAYDTVFLDVQKYVECKKYADALDIPFYYLQEWDDKYGITQPKMTDAIRSKIAIAGSSRRDDVNDFYLMMHLPLKRFSLKSK